MKQFIFNIIKITLLSVLTFQCKSPVDEEKARMDQLLANQNEHSNELLAINASQHGVKYPETFVLMQNRKGLRIEYNIDRSNLQIWISPQAGKSLSYVDKNWSNRDDFTRVFDRILIPGLNLNTFDSCDYDPFHSIMYFKDQTLHISQVYDQPMVLVWFDKEGMVDFKIYGEEVVRSDKEFVINHTDRGRKFQSAAILGAGEGEFQQQLVVDEYRSIHTRAHMAPGQLLVIASETEGENIAHEARNIASSNLEHILEENEKDIEGDLAKGRFMLKDRPEMQRLLEKSRRVTLSMQDFDGFMRSTNQYIYYLLWYRDGGMNTGHLTYTGWVEPVKDHAKFALLNPNISYEEPKGKFFGQLMAGPITKWEEDGLFFVVWPAFAYWTQTGDDRYCKGEYMKNMEQGMEWLEKYCYDEEKGLFGRYHYCETPLAGSRGHGWDNATGAPTFTLETEYDDHVITRSYDLYINSLNYASYMMLSMMKGGEEGMEYQEKARILEQNMIKFFKKEDSLPLYGLLLTRDNEMIEASPYGMDRTDYRWSMSIPPILPNLPELYKNARNQLLKDLMVTPKGAFLCAYNAILTSMDTEIHSEDSIMMAMDYLVPQSIRPGKYLPMPYTVPELVDQEDGDPFHDVRPLVYSIAPWLSAVTNLGIRRLPFGIALRGTKYLDSIIHYEYKNALLNVNYRGNGDIENIILNDKELINTLQVPESRLKENTRVIVNMSDNITEKENILIASTLMLNTVRQAPLRYSVYAHGYNVLTFKNLSGKINITDTSGKEIDYNTKTMDNLSYIEFEGQGEFIATIQN